MTRNALALVGGEQGKYSHIFKDVDFDDRNYEVPSEDEQFAAEEAKALNVLADIFDLGPDINMNDIEQFSTYQQEDADKTFAEKLVQKEEETLDTVTEAEREKEFDERQVVYERDSAEREGLTTPSWSQSTDQVIDNSNRRSFADVNQSSSHLRQATGTTPSSSAPPIGGSTTSSSTQRGTRKAGDEFQRMIGSIQRLAAQRTNNRWVDYKETEEEYFARFANNTPFWKRGMRKVRNFFKGGKGRITLKMGIVIALQLGMSVFGKKYEFENMGQMIAMFSFMLASFFMSRELAEEGLDVSGMIF